MKALFYRKCCSADDYKKLSNNYESFGQWLSFSISKTILLDNNEYKLFISDFSKIHDFISNNISLMHMDKNDKVSCLFITTNNTDGYLVYSAGYKYARYVAEHKRELEANVS